MSSNTRKNSSFSTVLALYNNMLGGALLSFPILYRDAGLFSSTIIVVISCVISFCTCRIYIMHNRSDQGTVEQSIKRILGKRGQQMFRFITGCYIVFLNIIYLDLIVDQLYSTIYYFYDMNQQADHIARKDQLTFSKFSTQWLTLILFFPIFGLLSIKNTQFLVKISQYGSYAIFIFMFYVIYKFFLELIRGQLEIDAVNWFSLDLGALAGTSSLAFSVHAFVVPIIKQNRHHEKNQRDLGFTYILGFVTYESVAFLGAIAVAANSCRNTFVDCYLSDWTILLVEITYFLSIVSAFPIMVEVGRTRILDLFFGGVSNKKFMIFNSVFMPVATFFSIISPIIPLSTLISLVGAFFCYFFIYLIPSYLHFSCLYSPNKNDPLLSESMLTQEAKEVSFDQNSTDKKLILTGCNHDGDYVHRRPKWLRYTIYGGFNLIGLGVGVFGIYENIRSIANN